MCRICTSHFEEWLDSVESLLHCLYSQLFTFTPSLIPPSLNPLTLLYGQLTILAYPLKQHIAVFRNNGRKTRRQTKYHPRRLLESTGILPPRSLLETKCRIDTYLIQCALGRVPRSRSWRGCSWSTWGRPPPHTHPSWRSPPGTSDRSPGQIWTHGHQHMVREIQGINSILWIRIGFQCCGSGSGIRCLFDPWIRDPE